MADDDDLHDARMACGQAAMELNATLDEELVEAMMELHDAMANLVGMMLAKDVPHHLVAGVAAGVLVKAMP